MLRRIANVAFHILTLGIPLGLYTLYSYVVKKGADSGQAELIHLSDLPIGVKNQKVSPYPKAGNEALTFARQILKDNPQLVDFYEARKHKPTNAEIGKLVTYSNTAAWPELYKAFEENPESPWSAVPVLEAAEKCMKLGYAISVLTLEDLAPFTEKLLVERSELRSFAKALTKQDAYQYRTFFFCTTNYHHFRSAAFYGTSPWNSYVKGMIEPNETPKSHALPYYTKGTVQYTWRELYNDYCRRVREYVKEADLESADPRFVSWTKEERRNMDFCSYPDTQPT